MAADSPNVWTFLIAIVTLLGVIAGPLVNWLITKGQTSTIKQDNAEAAKEVKADLAVAKAEIKGHADVREAKLDAVAQKVAVTEVMVNGDRAAKEARIKKLEARLRDKGVDPDND
jgi:Tfp pilus assembly major pilin PilA